MQCTHSFLVPEYYPDFLCKTSECRHPCCEGWNITISMNDYFRLVGAECSKELRGKLDCALKVTGGTEDGRYANISCDYTGRCKLHRDDGLCAIQKELGEEFLPSICRYYPRAVHHSYKDKCICSNSCEAVIEMLSEIKEPLKFIEKQMTIERVPDDKLINFDEFKIQQDCIHIIQDRKFSLPDRLGLLCDYIWDITDKDNVKIQPDIAEALFVQHLFTNWFEANSISMRDFCYETQQYYGTQGREDPSDDELADAVIRYQDGKNAFEKFYPEWQILFEHIIINHMLYEEFPYSEKHDDVCGSFVSLAAAYSFLRYNAIGYCYKHPENKSLFDLAAAMFRLIDHSRFNHNAAVILGKLNYNQPEKLKNLILI